MGKLLLIDGHSILNRAYYGIPKLTNSEGIHTNAVYGFVNILFRIIDLEKPDFLTVSFDLHGPTFRHKMFEEYKGQRKKADDEFREQVPLIQELLSAMDVTIVTKEGYEADDVLGTLAKRSEADGYDVTIVSGDKDLLQLASDRIKIIIPTTRGGNTTLEEYYAKDVVAKLGVTPEEFIDVKAIMGDSSDNYKGIVGIGEKKAFPLIQEYHSIENVYEHVEELTPPSVKTKFKEQYEDAVFCKKLATICVDAPIEYDINDAALTSLYTKAAYDMCRRLEFKNLLSKFNIEEENDIEKYFQIVESREELLDIVGALDETNCGLSYLIDESKQVAQDACDAKFKEPEQLDLFSMMSNDNQNEKEALDNKKYISYGLVAIALRCNKNVYAAFVGDDIAEDDLINAINEVSTKSKLCHNDCKKLLHDMPIERRDNLSDVGVAAYLINPLQKEYSAEVLGKDYVDILLPDFSELFKKKTIEEVIDNDRENLAKKMCYEAYVYGEAMPIVLDKLKQENMLDLFNDIEMPLVFTLYEMEKEGINMDADELRSYGVVLQDRIDELQSKIYSLAGEEFNINSPKQLGEVLFSEDKLALPGSKKTKTGYSTSAAVLEKLAPEHEIIAYILEYRQYTKLKSTYVEGLIAAQALDGKIHCNFQQTVTATGRLSCTEPNLQNIPIRMELGRLIRKVFYASENTVFIDADYSQVELRVLAHMSGDEELIRAFNEGKDIHRATAAKVFDVDFDEVNDLQRRAAKAVNFGIVYGESSFGLSENLGISKKEAKKYIDDYFVAYPKMKEYLDSLIQDAKDKGYSCTMLGRRRPIPELSSNNFMQRSFGERVAMNTPIQGTAADIIKIAMIHISDRLRKENLKSKLILQVHDEVLIEAAKDEEEVVRRIITEEMMNAISLSVPLEVDIHSGANWFEAK